MECSYNVSGLETFYKMFVATGYRAQVAELGGTHKTTTLDVPVDQHESLTRFPPLGESFLRRCEYSMGLSGRFQTEKIVIADAILRGTSDGVTFETAAVRCLGDSLHLIAQKMPMDRGTDTYKCWYEILTHLFTWLGAPRTCALVWKLYGKTTVEVSQLGENVAFEILGKFFPGLCSYNDDNRQFRIARHHILYSLLATVAIDMHLLPDGLRVPLELCGFCFAPFVSTILMRGVTCVGHARWVCVDVAAPEQEDLRKAVGFLAMQRGIVNYKAVAFDATVTNIKRYALENIAYAVEPLAIGIVATIAEMPDLIKYVLPYASVVVLVGANLRPLISPHEQPAFDWPRVSYRYYNEENPSRQFGGVHPVLVTNVEKLHKNDKFVHVNEPVPSGKALILSPDDIDAELSEETKKYISKTYTVLFTGPGMTEDRIWKGIMNKLLPHMHDECFVRLLP